MAFHRFQVRRIGGYDYIAQIIMDEKLLPEFIEAGVLNPNTLTLQGINKGGFYTLEPLDDTRVMVFRSVRRAFIGLTEKPTYHLSTTVGRVDALIDAVELLFKEIEFVHVENKDDLENIINPPKDPNFTHKIFKVSVLGDMLKEVLATGAIDEESTEEKTDAEASDAAN